MMNVNERQDEKVCLSESFIMLGTENYSRYENDDMMTMTIYDDNGDGDNDDDKLMMMIMTADDNNHNNGNNNKNNYNLIYQQKCRKQPI